TCTFFLEKIVHVLEVLVVPTLVARHGNRLNVLLDGCIHNFFDTSIVTKVNYLTARGLNDTPHDVDCRVMAVEQTCRRYYPDFILRLVRIRPLMAGKSRFLFRIRTYCFLLHVTGLSDEFQNYRYPSASTKMSPSNL